uniref:LRRNT domain-containing protein n=1 Tax=Steinernema glaseri TaxID=37863 RepID=A0A1I7YGX5_9BILA
MVVTQLLILTFFVLWTSEARDLKVPESFQNKLESLYETLEQQNPCHDFHCDFPSRCMTMPNTRCEDCQAIAVCVNFG